MLKSTNFPTKLLFHLTSCMIIVNCFEIPLDNGWFLENSNKSIQIENEQIPTGVYTALEKVGITGSVLYSYNDVNLRWISKDTWTYSLNFDVADVLFNHSYIILVFHGLDTIATITLNGRELLPMPNNMFVRYRYDVKKQLIKSNNHLIIHFESPIEKAKQYAAEHNFTPPECPNNRYHGECHMNFLRKMQASFSWDWGLAAPSVGIWKPVNIEVYDTAIIRDVTYYLNLFDDDWEIVVTVYMESGVDSNVLRSFDGYLFLTFVDLHQFNTTMEYVSITRSTEGTFNRTISTRIPKNLVELWWPNGYGKQALYKLNVTWLGGNRNILTNEIKQIPSEYLKSEKVIQVGFRTIELIEDEAEFGNLFYFKVNNVAIFLKGTNWIPSDIRPERLADENKIEYLMKAVTDSHMNAIRVWGGGVYESDLFYNLADENGILIWQDMMFACAMYPVFPSFIDSVQIEIEQNIRRLQSHPSILVWAGNNENEAALVQNWYGTRGEQARFIQEYIELYRSVSEVVEKNDKWHKWLYSSPSNGNKINKIINSNPQDNNYGDVHHYNYISDGWDSNIYPKARFVSEYGFQSMPSVHSIVSSMNISDRIHDLMDHRQHFPFGNTPIIGLINKHFPFPDEEHTLEYWHIFVYLSQIAQAMSIKTETETYRVGRYFEWRTMGALYWQLNDIWTAPSWSSIEYNGNFKILHYWAKSFFAPIHVVANLDVLNNLNIFVIRDTLGKHQSLELRMKIYKWSSLRSVFERNWNISMPENTVILAHKKKIDDYLNNSIKKTNSFFYFELRDQDTYEILATNFLFLDKLKKIENAVDPNLQYSLTNNYCDQTTNTQTATINIRVSAPAIFVYIKLMNSLIETYSLSKNGFIQLKSQDNVLISFYNRNCAMAFHNDDIQISTVNHFLIK